MAFRFWFGEGGGPVVIVADISVHPPDVYEESLAPLRREKPCLHRRREDQVLGDRIGEWGEDTLGRRRSGGCGGRDHRTVGRCENTVAGRTAGAVGGRRFGGRRRGIVLRRGCRASGSTGESDGAHGNAKRDDANEMSGRAAAGTVSPRHAL